MNASTLLSSWENPQDVSRANILFENRNKSYGGYFIRVHYPERIFRAFVFALLGFGVFMSGLLMAGKFITDATIIIPPYTGPERVYYTPGKPTEKPEEKSKSPPKKSGN